MSVPQLHTALNAGEISPDLFGRTDLDKYSKGASTYRNFFASYRGGAVSRPGTKFAGQCKQAASASSLPPVLIPFQFSVTEGIALELGDQYMRFAIDGAYVTEDPLTITGITEANPGVVSVANPWSDGDWIFLSGIGGMTKLNNRIFIVANQGAGSVTLVNPLTGAAVDTSALSAYTSGGTAARIYTLATPYAAADLPMLKWTQSADVMTLVHPSYAPHDLSRITNANWQLAQTDFGASIAAPSGCVAAPTSPATTSSDTWYYQYVATAVDTNTGEESVASNVAQTTSQNIATTAGSIFLNVGTVQGASSYNWYRAPVAFGQQPQLGTIFGYVGTSLGPTWTDSNITPDYTTVPPSHTNPFATQSVLSLSITNAGTGYGITTTTVSITSGTGAGFVGLPIVGSSGLIQAVVIENGGAGYTEADTVVFTDSGAGTGATATLTVGPSSGTYPGCAAYFQQRRFYANTDNNPDSYFASKPGAFKNMDTSIPVTADDAITGSPWSQQVNGIQWMINMPGGLVILTGGGAWQLSGGGGGLATASPITPSSQVANPQAYNGVSPLIRPITINYDILYVQEKGSIVRDLSYNFFVNIYTGTDMTVLSNHLFTGHTILRWDWAEEPYKLLWAVRDDGILLCLTYLKEQDVYAWSRHDTNGLFQSVCCISEPPVNAAYFIVKRLIQNNGSPVWAYFLERMDDRIWSDIEDSWCVDAGLSYPQSTPNGTLSIESGTGTPTLDQPSLVYGGANYGANTYVELTDPTGVGAIVNLTIGGGVITAVTFSGVLTGYTNPSIRIIDPSGMGGGAAINVSVSYLTTASSSPGVFANTPGQGAIGDVIRVGAGIAQITAYGGTTSVTVNVLRDVTETIPNDPNNTPIPAASGDWTIATPTSTVNGLDHLEGMLVSVLADGDVVGPFTVANGSITLPAPASKIVVGLGYACQLQTLYFDVPSPVTVQGRRKTIFNVLARVEQAGGPFELGANQPDASVQPGNATVAWANMTPVNPPFPGQSPLQPYPFYTGDVYQNVQDSLGMDQGQVAVQMTVPLPLTVLALVVWADIGDDAG